MNLAAWAERNGVARVTGYRWFQSGRLPVPAQRVDPLILVHDAAAESAQCRRRAVYARVSPADQKADLDRQVGRVTVWATKGQLPVDKVVTGIGSALYGQRRTLLAVLGDPSVGPIVVGHRIGLPAWALKMWKPHWPRGAESVLWWTAPRLTATWWAR